MGAWLGAWGGRGSCLPRRVSEGASQPARGPNRLRSQAAYAFFSGQATCIIEMLSLQAPGIGQGNDIYCILSLRYWLLCTGSTSPEGTPMWDLAWDYPGV